MVVLVDLSVFYLFGLYLSLTFLDISTLPEFFADAMDQRFYLGIEYLVVLLQNFTNLFLVCLVNLLFFGLV